MRNHTCHTAPRLALPSFHQGLVRRCLLLLCFALQAISAWAQSDTLLSSGITYNGGSSVGLLGAGGQETFYRIIVPAGQTKLTVETGGGDGDVDLFVRRGSRPTVSINDGESLGASTAERVVINNPAADTYYIMLKGYGSGYLGVAVRATYEGASGLPTWRWAKSTEGNQSSIDARFPTGAAIDSGGNAYLVGQFNGTAQFGSFALTATASVFPGLLTGQAGFLAKYDANGQVVWAVTNVGATARAVALAPDNTVVVTGDFSGTVRFATGASLTGPRPQNTFLAKYNASTGALIWAKTILAQGRNSGLAIACSARTGDIYIGGYETKATTRVPSGTLTGIFSRTSANGSTTALSFPNGTDINYITGLALDADDTLYIAGAYKANLEFFRDQNDRLVTLTSGRTSNDVPTLDGFVAKIPSTGGMAWAQTIAGNSTDDAASALALDGSGGAYISGSMGNGHFLAKYDNSGTRAWLLASTSGAGADYGTALAPDGRGGVYWAGAFRGVFSFGSTSLNSGSSGGSANIGGYLINVASNNAVQWNLQATSEISALAANANGTILLGGTYVGSIRLGTTNLFAGFSSARETFIGRLDATFAPAITRQPSTSAVAVGQTATLTVEAGGTAPISYQWRKNGVNITGATTATLTLIAVPLSDNGARYDVVVTNSAGTVTSSAVTLTVANASQTGRIINLSILTAISSATDSFTMGYVVGGSSADTKPLLIRAAGPSLSALGVGGVLADPKIELFAGSTKSSENDNWGGSATLTTAMTSVGAFAYSGATSKDAASFAQVSRGDNSVRVTGVAGATGAVIAEIYDATPTAEFTAATPKLVNVSVLKNIGAGLTAGFVIGGSTAKTVLIRAIGPTLAGTPFNVAGAVTDPQMSLFRGSTKISENNDWGGGTALASTFTQVGAFSLPTNSKDAVLVSTLEPGNYSVQVTGVGGQIGVALIEIYEVP